MRIFAYFFGIDDDDNPCKEQGPFFLVLHSSTPQTGNLKKGDLFTQLREVEQKFLSGNVQGRSR